MWTSKEVLNPGKLYIQGDFVSVHRLLSNDLHQVLMKKIEGKVGDQGEPLLVVQVYRSEA